MPCHLEDAIRCLHIELNFRSFLPERILVTIVFQFLYHFNLKCTVIGLTFESLDKFLKMGQTDIRVLFVKFCSKVHDCNAIEK